ncbi:hypothetical protein F4556_000592 [Kitasatospora gansuensis]|uniref:Uncharacterized protein n=1 Tax=Kitasatospora gansuensis TaxID=258050 RepID=A0A7W7WER7_9ACTN|nr:hypothetical protein [Kitasatospora gansuensis]MBB4945057.1 hypothetical protein [Kitasatospora gansuensis]
MEPRQRPPRSLMIRHEDRPGALGTLAGSPTTRAAIRPITDALPSSVRTLAVLAPGGTALCVSVLALPGRRDGIYLSGG